MSLENKSKDKATNPEIEEEEQAITSVEPTLVDPTTVKEEEDIQPPIKEVQEAITQVVNNATVNATAPVPAADTELTGPIKTLKDAFPNLDVDIIQTILQNHNGNVDGAFETLLGMSDPNYKPEQTDNNMNPDQQLRQDEAFARQLVADEANRSQPTQQHADNEPLFNFQEDLPAIKEKAIELGTAAKNKIMSFYNHLVSGDNMSAGNAMTTNNNQGNTLERDLGNLNISDNQNIQRQPQQQRSVDLYEWDGQPTAAAPPAPTSTSNDQLLADEEFARQLAREDAEAAAAATNTATVATTAPQSVQDESSPTPVATPAKNINIGPLKSGNLVLAKENDSSSNHEEVTFTTPDNNNQGKVKGFAIDNNEDDDLDDLFMRDDSNVDSTKSDAKPEKK
ncbi:hypothetical protein K501DRAFT_311004 [Backusella circina FSU 941]|nr:hypothetical protein K501DRAFT_311004 [Backusella circina FSU 941]